MMLIISPPVILHQLHNLVSLDPGNVQAAQHDEGNQQVLYEYAIMRYIYGDKDWSNLF